MKDKTKIDYKEWRSIPINEWNLKSFQTYLADQYKEKYGTKYVTNSYGFEGKKLKEMLAEYDNETIRRFIDACYHEYRPTAKWPTVNFAGMYSFMRAQMIPKVQLQMKAERLFAEEEALGEKQVTKSESSENINELKGWF